MARLLTILSIIFAILFFPPAALALISNNAVPGDATYPIKRGLEDVILKIASINPATKAWFSIQRSGRRFEEAKVLLIGGKTQATDSLDELVIQTQSVSVEISQIQDPVKKQELTQKLTDEIKKYDDGLEKVKQEISQVPTPTNMPQQPTPTVQPTPIQPGPTSTASPASTSTPQPTNTPRPRATPTPTATPQPISTPQPSVTPTPPPQLPPSKCDEIEDPIERAICRLQGIELGLRANVQHTNSTSTPTPRGHNNNENKNLTPKLDTGKKEPTKGE